MEDVMEILETNPDIKDNPSAINIEKKGCDIEFKDVDFKYPNKEDYALKKMSFSISKGQSIAIVGDNGSGKSTITKLLYRLYDATNGQILFHINNIKNIKLASLRNLIGIVPQDAFLLNNTIYANLMFGFDTEVEKELFLQIMKITKLNELANKLPEKYETQIGERASYLEEKGSALDWLEPY